MAKTLIKATFFAIILAALFCAATLFQTPVKTAYAADLCDLVTPELVKMYEEEIAGRSVVGNMSEAKLQRIADRFQISVNKVRAIYLMQDLAAMVGKEYTLDELAQMDEWSLFAAAKSCGEIYYAAQTPERQEELKTLLKNALGM